MAQFAPFVLSSRTANRTACRDTDNPRDLEYYSDDVLEMALQVHNGTIMDAFAKWGFDADEIRAELLRRELSKL